MTIFKTGDFTFHSGSKSNFKIDLDDLTDEDWAALADQVGRNCWHKFGMVVGVPHGGTKFAQALAPYVTEGSPNILIVDDVFTTGASMEEMRADVKKVYPDQWSFGIVVFTRTENLPTWVFPMFECRGWFIT